MPGICVSWPMTASGQKPSANRKSPRQLFSARSGRKATYRASLPRRCSFDLLDKSMQIVDNPPFHQLTAFDSVDRDALQ